jgi:DNA-binding phage protein
MTKTSKFDYREYLDTPERMAAYMHECDVCIGKLMAALEDIADLRYDNTSAAAIAQKVLDDL